MILENVGHVDTVMMERIYSHLKQNENAKSFLRRVKKVDRLNPKKRMAISPVIDLFRLVGLGNE